MRVRSLWDHCCRLIIITLFFHCTFTILTAPRERNDSASKPTWYGVSFQWSGLLSGSCFSKDLEQYELREIMFTIVQIWH